MGNRLLTGHSTDSGHSSATFCRARKCENSCFEAVRVNVNIREMAKSKKKWVALSTDQLNLESTNQASSCKMVGDHVIHCVEPIPDTDWVGETWGLYFSDYEDELMELLEQDTEKYITKQPEYKINPRINEVKVLSCPAKNKTPPPAPCKEKSPPPAPKKKAPVPVSKKPELTVNPPVEPETLIEMVLGSIGVLAKFEQKYDEGCNYINKHKEGSNKSQKACVTTVQCLTCPQKEIKIKNPPPPAPDLPCQWLPDNALHPGLPLVSECEVKDVKKEDNKWSWMRDEDQSVGRTKYRLSMYW